MVKQPMRMAVMALVLVRVLKASSQLKMNNTWWLIFASSFQLVAARLQALQQPTRMLLR